MTSNLCCATLCSTVFTQVANSQTATCSFDITLIASAQDNNDSNRGSWLTLQNLISCGCLASVPNGHVAFLCDALVPVVSLNNCWVGFDGRCLTTTSGELFLWGSGGFGQLGTGDTTARSIPVPEITKGTAWCQVNGGSYITQSIKTNGTLWTWGFNNYGQLGDNTTTNRSSPVQEISSSTNWCVVSGFNPTVALKTTGTLWAWGRGFCGGLGNNRVLNVSSAVQEITSSTNWCRVSNGSYNTGAINTSGQLWVWGWNACGSLGNNSTISRSSPVRESTSSSTWTQVSLGKQSHSTALRSDGTLWTWGMNAYGSLGSNTTVDRSTPGREVSSSSNWCQVSAGRWTTIAIKTDGSLWAWGQGTGGALGNGTFFNRSSPVQEITQSFNWCLSSAFNHTSALKTDGTLWSWGCGYQGQLGNCGRATIPIPVQECRSLTNWCQVATGTVNTMGLTISETFVLC